MQVLEKRIIIPRRRAKNGFSRVEVIEQKKDLPIETAIIEVLAQLYRKKEGIFNVDA